MGKEETDGATERLRLLPDELDTNSAPTPGFVALYCLAQASVGQLGVAATYETSLTVAGVHYVLSLVIGNGGTAKIYKATAAGKEYVVKLSRAERISAEVAIYEQLAPLKIPCVPTLVAHTAVAPACLVLMPLGEPLAASLPDDGFMSLPACMKAGQAILACLAQVHNAGFLHGDVHPGNVIRVESQYYLIDWENAQRISALTPRSKLMGIPAYLTDDFLCASEFRPYMLSIKDDLMGLAYTLLSLSLGVLPWADIKPLDIPHARSTFEYPRWFTAFKTVLYRPGKLDYDALSACLSGKDPTCTVLIHTGRRAGNTCGRGLPCQYHGVRAAFKYSE